MAICTAAFCPRPSPASWTKYSQVMTLGNTSAISRTVRSRFTRLDVRKERTTEDTENTETRNTEKDKNRRPSPRRQVAKMRQERQSQAEPSKARQRSFLLFH